MGKALLGASQQPELGAGLSEHRGLPRKRRLKSTARDLSNTFAVFRRARLWSRVLVFAPVPPWQPKRCPGKSRVKRIWFLLIIIWKHILGVRSRGHQTAPCAGRTDLWAGGRDALTSLRSLLLYEGGKNPFSFRGGR